MKNRKILFDKKILVKSQAKEEDVHVRRGERAAPHPGGPPLRGTLAVPRRPPVTPSSGTLRWPRRPASRHGQTASPRGGPPRQHPQSPPPASPPPSPARASFVQLPGDWWLPREERSPAWWAAPQVARSDGPVQGARPQPHRRLGAPLSCTLLNVRTQPVSSDNKAQSQRDREDKANANQAQEEEPESAALTA